MFETSNESGKFHVLTPASDRALLVSFGETLSEESRLRVRSLVRALKGREDLFLRETQPAYSSVLLTFDPLKTDLDTLAEAIRPILSKIEKSKDVQKGLKPRHVEIPVCYESPLAPDLADVAKAVGLTMQAVIDLHSATEFTVCFFGFMPGFSYWSGLPEKLAVPRLTTPRLKVPPGSVAIGGTQTGIYPIETPGGWRIIGRTPVKMFDPSQKRLCYLQLGDRVRLRPISLAEFERAGGTWES